MNYLLQLNTDVLDFGVELQRMVATFTSNAGFLHPTEGRGPLFEPTNWPLMKCLISRVDESISPLPYLNARSLGATDKNVFQKTCSALQYGLLGWFLSVLGSI